MSSGGNSQRRSSFSRSGARGGSPPSGKVVPDRPSVANCAGLSTASRSRFLNSQLRTPMSFSELGQGNQCCSRPRTRVRKDTRCVKRRRRGNACPGQRERKHLKQVRWCRRRESNSTRAILQHGDGVRLLARSLCDSPTSACSSVCWRPPASARIAPRRGNIVATFRPDILAS